jgi:SAM-dependent methyltransferase
VTTVAFDVWSALVLLGLVLSALGGCWLIIPLMHGLRYVPARYKWIRQALKIANVQPGETVYDLGAGDGRVLLIAAREFGAHAVGIEIEPVHCVLAWLKALFNGVITQVTIRRENLLNADPKEADVVFLYLTPAYMEQLCPKLERQLRPGTRVVSLSFPFENWQPSDIDIGHLIFLYRMPPQPGNIDTFLQKTLT